MISEVRDRTVTVGRLSMHSLEAGTGEPVVVLHHSTGPYWSEFLDHLASSFTVCAPDMAGYGQSTRPDTARTPAELAIYTGLHLDALGVDRVHLVGLGFGGFVAAELALMNQRRARTLTIVGAAGIKPENGEIRDPLVESWMDYVAASFSNRAAFEAHFGPEPATELVDLWDYSREMTARVTWKPWMWNLGLPDMLRGLQTPALVVWGDQDRIVPSECGERYVEVLPNARLKIVCDSGHAVDLEHPAVLAKLVTSFVGDTID